MHRPLADKHRVAVGAEGAPQRGRGIERCPSLLEHHHAQAVGPGDACRRQAESRPPSTRSSVLLPLPLGPSRPSLVPGVSVRSIPAKRDAAGRRAALAMPAAVSSLRVCRPRGDEVDAGRAGGGVAVFQLRQFLAALSRRRRCAKPALRVRAAALRPSHSVSRRTWLATDSCCRAWASRNSSRRSTNSS